MTVIAGAISRTENPLPTGLREALVANLSRFPGDAVENLGGSRWLLAKVDVGAFRCKGSFSAPDAAALVLAGEPLLSDRPPGAHANREAEGRVLFEDLCRGGRGALESAAGTFCGAFYSAAEHRLTLISDKLGVRPLYYIVTPEFAAFTSALRVFEAAGLHRGGMNPRGVYETCAFGFPLADRTAYRDIRAAGPAELIHIGDEAESHELYFRWDRLGRTDCGIDELTTDLVGMFEAGLRRRLRNDQVALAFLSGGLDSRAIVSALRKNDVAMQTVNFAPPQTQDRHFATLAADALGTRHHQLDVPLSAATDVYRQEQLSSWIAALPASARPDRPQCIWSGDGGSVGMGHVYLDADTVQAFERGEVDAGIRSFLRFNRIPGASNAAMTRRFREETRNWHVEGIREDVAAIESAPPDRVPFLFLMRNDQRRHMVKHFENIDVRRFEFLLPFFDADFVARIVRAPVAPFLRHELYQRWLQALSPVATTVPWQAYPGHVPCPIPSGAELRYQWGDYFGKAEDRRIARNHGRDAVRSLFARPFPSHLISRAGFATGVLASLSGSLKYSHLVRVGNTFVRYSQQSPDRAAGSGQHAPE